MTDIEKARRLFQDEGLAFPMIPGWNAQHAGRTGIALTLAVDCSFLGRLTTSHLPAGCVLPLPTVQ